MPFNTALSGIRAANDDLRLTGNNIANASTAGFKESRAEFGDVYSTTVLGSGVNQVGSGVRIQSVAQQFAQGNISFTENVLDLAVSGSGFFVTNLGGDQTYTRSGTFGLDQDGYVVNNINSRLQGYRADSLGNIGGLIEDIQIQASNLEPEPTTAVEAELNLDSREDVIQSTGTRYISAGGTATANNNGYAAQDITFTDPSGGTVNFTSNANDNTQSIANNLNALPGVTATASATATVSTWTAGLGMTINGVTLTATSMGTAAATEITALPGLTAVYDAATPDLTITSTTGDLSFGVTGGSAGNTLVVTGSSGGALTLNQGSTDTTVVGGLITLELDENYSFDDSATVTPIFTNAPTSFVNNAFDPTDASTYNHSTSMTIYDSLGNPHTMQQFFIKQPYDPADATTYPNHWQLAIRIDGADVGDPVISAPTAATVATYDLHFTRNGAFDETLSDDILISNWTPLDEAGNPLGTLQPLNIADGGALPVANPATSSNFQVLMSDTTQVGSAFEVRALDQNGSTTGRLAGLNVDDAGIIFARYTNGENQVLAQVALADFANTQGLQSLGDTSWAETSESGVPVIGGPGTASLGLIQSGALEDSNVDLSEQLVNLIIAQRNFQASAKTIETADQTTQTIINLR
ncbi:MAG: flagellar hook protein FlgE [Cellvibrionaceae bacterium]|nr:flagellar hook protein FlgE [Cellvibrionaceae bacterium]